MPEEVGASSAGVAEEAIRLRLQRSVDVANAVAKINGRDPGDTEGAGTVGAQEVGVAIADHLPARLAAVLAKAVGRRSSRSSAEEQAQQREPEKEVMHI